MERDIDKAQERQSCVAYVMQPQYLQIAADNRALKMFRALSGLSVVLVSMPSAASGEGMIRTKCNTFQTR
jgi:hypothetical protein